MSELGTPLRGRVWVFGDSVDTNQLAGGGIEGRDAADTLRLNCLRGLRPEFPDQVSAGDILVTGRNFGCGSSRQAAVEALKVCGIAVVLAESVARIHRRNSVALALPTFAVPGVSAVFSDGDIAEVDYPARAVTNVRTGIEIALPSLPASVEQIYAAGGLMQIVRQRLSAIELHPADDCSASSPG